MRVSLKSIDRWNLGSATCLPETRPPSCARIRAKVYQRLYWRKAVVGTVATATKPSCSLARHWPVHRSQVGTGGEERATRKVKYLQSGGSISKLGRTGPKALPVVWLWSSLHNDIWIGTTLGLARGSAAAPCIPTTREMRDELVFQTSDMRNRCNSQWQVRSSRKLDRIKDTSENLTA